MQRVYRLTNNASFNYIYRKGEHFSSENLTLFCVRATSVKVGISVSKKVGKSVVRSSVKRLIDENFRALIPYLNTTCNYVITAREPAATADFYAIKRDVIKVLTKAGHLSDTFQDVQTAL